MFDLINVASSLVPSVNESAIAILVGIYGNCIVPRLQNAKLFLAFPVLSNLGDERTDNLNMCFGVFLQSSTVVITNNHCIFNNYTNTTMLMF